VLLIRDAKNLSGFSHDLKHADLMEEKVVRRVFEKYPHDVRLREYTDKFDVSNLNKY
jgi:hypothetical protein